MSDFALNVMLDFLSLSVNESAGRVSLRCNHAAGRKVRSGGDWVRAGGRKGWRAGSIFRQAGGGDRARGSSGRELHQYRNRAEQDAARIGAVFFRPGTARALWNRLFAEREFDGA